MKITRISIIALIIFLSAIYAILLAQKIDLTTSDLGRHLKNGELFLESFSVPQKNFYSYTYPDYPFINHHWATGVVFFLLYNLAGFTGLSIFFILISIVTFFIFFDIASKYSSPIIATIVSIFIIPVLGSRIEIRPEIFSYLFCGAFFWILWNCNQGKIGYRWLFVLPLIELFWVNFHIYFFLGPMLIGVFLIENIIRRKNFRWLLIILSFTALGALVNPAGITGALYPLKMFSNYGYRLFENQSVLFIQNLMNYPPAFYFELAFGILLLSWLVALRAIIKKHAEFSVANFIITVAFGAIGWLMVRNFTIFGYFALPIAAINFGNLIKDTSVKNEYTEYFSAIALALTILIFLIIINPNYWHSRNKIGLGIEPATNKAAEFFIKENIAGPIFNNYDIGGYLIYYLFPKERVFIDNRPEAYPESFFKEIYIPMQETDEKWNEELKKYNFNTIFFYRNDLTPWAQSFLVRRVADPNWAAIYVDDNNIIFLKRTEFNRTIIQKYELPKNTFNTSQSQ